MYDINLNKLRRQQDELPYQVKVYYEDGENELIPGVSRNPDNLHYGLDQFMDLDIYEMLCDVVVRLKLEAKDQLKIVLAVLNHLDSAKRSNYAAIKAEVINRKSGEVVASSED